MNPPVVCEVTSPQLEEYPEYPLSPYYLPPEPEIITLSPDPSP